jgi:AraC-like DNA-binding protein
VVPHALKRPLEGLAAEYAPGDEIPLHQHPFAQLLFASSGVMTVGTEHGTWVVPPERAVWVPARVGHSIRMTGRVSMRTIYLAEKLGPLAGNACCVVQVSALLREGILRAVTFAQPYREDGPDARVVAVIADEIRAAPTAPLHLPLPRDPRARRVVDALCANPGDPRTLGDWARIAGASARTLERLFERETKLPFAAWRQQARLLRGLEQLASGESVTAVALDLGYETPSAFIAMFRRALGTSPGRYFRARS